MIAACSCSESAPHIMARRTTFDGVRVEVWDNGAITGRMGFALEGVPIARSRAPEAIERARRAAWLFAGEVEIHNVSDLGALYAACRWAAERDGLPGTVRARLAQLERPKLTPVWTVVSADRDGRPTCRYWKLPRMLAPGTVVWDHVGVGASGGRYEITRIVSGTDDVLETSGIRFATLAAVADFILSEREARS